MNTPVELQHAASPLARIIAPLQTAWNMLVEPGPSITSREQQSRTRLLSAILITVFVVGGLVMISRAIQFPHTVTDPDYLGVVVALFVVLGLYGLSRRGATDLAAASIIGLMLFIFVGFSFVPNSLSTLLYFSVIPILLAAIFFNVRTVIGLTVAAVIVSMILSQVSDAMYFGEVSDASQFIVLSAAVIVIYMNYTRAIEEIRRAELQAAYDQVRASEAILEQRVEERTQELRVAKEEAEQSDKVKSQFLAAMSHELRTPLNAILNFSQFVSSGMLGSVNDEQVDVIDKITASGKHLLSLINDVLDISKIESGALTLFVEDNIDLRDDVRAVEAAGASMLKDKPVTLTVNIQDNVPCVVGDRRRIRQIMLNLVSNACKFTEAGEVHIELKPHQGDGEVLFAVHDTGPGIAPEDQTAIFETFRQTETGLRHSEGTGLGLPISLRLTQAHGGRLWLESVPGQGATFYVALPVHSPHLLQMIRTVEKKEKV